MKHIEIFCGQGGRGWKSEYFHTTATASRLHIQSFPNGKVWSVPSTIGNF